jgi:uncharacterized membrane-anchored protein YitT (DUF2179 family)/predicted metal-dependent HD superfamily phosphohydrolase
MQTDSSIAFSKITKDQYGRVYTFLIKKLEAELPAFLTYHNVQHTIGVLETIEHLIIKEKVANEDSWLLLTAGLFHDAGFIKEYQNHEEQSCVIAREVLPQFDYTEESIKRIEQLIMATKLPQAPATHLEQIICDADLYYLGAEDFFPTAEKLYKEFKQEEIVSSYEDWQTRQLKFLETHRFFTTTALAEREERKQLYIKQLQLKYKIEKKKSRFSDHTLENIQDAFLMILGVIIAGFALKMLLVPNHFFDGGVTGISLLIHEMYHYNLGLVILLANLPMIAIGYFSISKRFAIKTLVCVSLLAICLLLFPFPEIKTGDNILIAIFGGFFLGVGIGLCMRAGCALDGVEVLALKAFKRTPFTVTEVILAINILIFSIAAFKLGIMTAFYSILTYFTASKSIDYVVEGIEAYTGVTIISSQSDLLKHRLVNELGRGITVYKGERGFLPGKFETSTDCDIIFTVVTRLELRRLKNLVYETDPKAFVFANTIKEASGGILRRRQVH